MLEYLNCEGAEAKVETRHCEYKEHSIDDDSNDGCVLHGLFDFDITPIRMEPTRTGVCQLDFVSLKYVCDADAFPFDWYFWMKAEVDLTTSHDDTSSILLWFGIDGAIKLNNCNRC